jgi:predicted permease
MKRLRSFANALLRRARFESELDEELRFHLEEYTAELVRSGVPAAEAARRARVEFGNVHNVKLDSRQARGARVLDEVGRNLTYSTRTLRKTPGVTASILATLAICLGATLTIFAVVDGVLLRPLPFPAADDLVSIYNTYPKAGVPNDGCSLTNYYERRDQIEALASISAYRDGTAIVGEPGATEREAITFVSAEFFTTLGLGPVRGRAFTEDETRPGQDRVVIVTDGYWQQRLNADPSAIGRRIRVNGNERTVVGVLPREFGFLSSKARLYLPLSSAPEERAANRRHWGNSDMIARVRPGVALSEAQAQIDAHNAILEATNPEAPRMADAGFRSVIVPLHADHVAPVRGMLLLLQAGALLLLVLGAVNVTNLFLIRASGRVRELALRRAIGASHRHIVHQVLSESVLVSLAGGILGIGIAYWGISLVGALGAEELPLGARIVFDARQALIGLTGAVAIGLLIACPAAWFHLQLGTAAALRVEGRGATAGTLLHRLRHGFVVAQLACAFVLLSGAGLLSLSLREVMTVMPGFVPANVLTGQMTLPGRQYPDVSAIVAFTDRLAERLASQPGVTSTAFATNVPFSGISNKSAATVKGYVPSPNEPPRGIYSYGVGGDFFSTMGIELREGEVLHPAELRTSERTCVVDEDFAARHWPGQSAIGQQLFQGGRPGPDDEAFRVIGVVGAIRQAALTEERGQGAVYYPFVHRADRNIFVMVRTKAAPDTLASTLRQVVRELDSELPVTDIKTMDARIGGSLVSRRSPALLSMIFCAIALLLAAVGTYGVLSYAVAERRREIGVRIALGARPPQVRGQFLLVAVRLLAIGLPLGVAGAWIAGRAMEGILFGVPALHLGTLVVAAAVLASIAIGAALVPAWRAARISPLAALAE